MGITEQFHNTGKRMFPTDRLGKSALEGNEHAYWAIPESDLSEYSKCFRFEFGQLSDSDALGTLPDAISITSSVKKRPLRVVNLFGTNAPFHELPKEQTSQIKKATSFSLSDYRDKILCHGDAVDLLDNQKGYDHFSGDITLTQTGEQMMRAKPDLLVSMGRAALIQTPIIDMFKDGTMFNLIGMSLADQGYAVFMAPRVIDYSSWFTDVLRGKHYSDTDIKEGVSKAINGYRIAYRQTNDEYWPVFNILATGHPGERGWISPVT